MSTGKSRGSQTRLLFRSTLYRSRSWLGARADARGGPACLRGKSESPIMERVLNPKISRRREAASMNRVLQVALAVTLGSLAGVAAAAQGARFGVGGGLLSPSGDFKNLDKTGWHGLVRVDFSIPMSPVGIRVDGLYGQTSHKAPYDGDGHSQGIGGLVSLVWNIPVPAPMVKPYVLAGRGVFHL